MTLGMAMTSDTTPRELKEVIDKLKEVINRLTSLNVQLQLWESQAQDNENKSHGLEENICKRHI